MRRSKKIKITALGVALALASLQVAATVLGLVANDPGRDLVTLLLFSTGAAALLMLLLPDDSRPS